MIRISIATLTLAAGTLVMGCTSDSSQSVSGRVDQAGFPSAVSAVRVVRGSTTVAESPVAADGAFSLAIPTGAGYRIELVSAEQPGLVFPRSTGVIEAAFTVKGSAAPFDLGTVRFIGVASTHVFRQDPAGAADGSDTADGECENGVDTTTGAICVDDAEEEGDQCGESGADCVDGIDSATGAECDGGPGANQNDGGDGADTADTSDGDGETADDALPAESAVADHNLPATIGCGDAAD